MEWRLGILTEYSILLYWGLSEEYIESKTRVDVASWMVNDDQTVKVCNHL